ncbi:MAG: ABC transporter permease subunit [Solirubrobacterales bacterium]|nr:ABC transporter permease subunit [Solirubrobacterales bacterium]
MSAPPLTKFARSPRRSGESQDRRTELVLGVLACGVLALVAGMVIFVFAKAWPSFSHNGLKWFGPGGDVGAQLQAIFNSPADPANYVYLLRAWPLIYATILVTASSVALALAFAVLSAIFIVEFAPNRLRRILEPTVRLLAAVPSVIYGLIGVLVLVPLVGNHLITRAQKESVIFVVQLTGNSLLVAVIVLTIMITPIMIAIIVDALRSVPNGWKEGAAALGVNRWRVMWTIVVRSARPAIIAAAVLATARALGEAIMLAMVAGSVAFSPNPLDGPTFFLEPIQPLASTIVINAEGLTVVPFGQTLYAFAAVLLVSAAGLSLCGYAAKQPLKRYGIRA